ncbi:MAG: DNA polymerase Y family protein, partial [Pseudomonadota bacterium]
MQPFAVLSDRNGLLTVHSLSSDAGALGLSLGQSLSDARAMRPDLLTTILDAPADQAFMAALQRWAGQFSPWVAIEGDTGLCLDITGCAHLFGGEENMIASLLEQTEGLHLTAFIGVADTVGAAWALARFGDQPMQSDRSGDAIEQEARATRSRAFKRRNWERGGPRPQGDARYARSGRIAPPGKTPEALIGFPVVALRLSEGVATSLARVGLKSIGDLLKMPRDALTRRFGAEVLRRLDQALGRAPEPISPSKPPVHFATRLSFPDPIGLPEDISAGIKRLLDPLCMKLKAHGHGCRKIQLTCMRSDGTYQVVEAGLASATDNGHRIFPLLTLKLPQIEPGYGIDSLRLQALVTEPLSPTQHSGSGQALAQAKSQRRRDTREEDLIGRLGARIGLERITIPIPAESIIPEKAVAEV